MQLRFAGQSGFGNPTDGVVDIVSFRDFYAFEQHVKTCRAKRGAGMLPQWYKQPVFYFSNHFALVHNGADVPVPAPSNEVDFELELGLVIGRTGRNISEAEAWDHVLGFTIVNDFSARDLQRAEMKIGLGPAKGKDFATAVGPTLIPLDDVRHLIDEGRINLAMQAKVNGTVVSRGNAADMYFSWPQIIAHASRNVDLQRGALLGSGTVGTGCILELGPENTGGWLVAGDTVELEIDRLGTLTNRIVSAENV